MAWRTKSLRKGIPVIKVLSSRERNEHRCFLGGGYSAGEKRLAKSIWRYIFLSFFITEIKSFRFHRPKNLGPHLIRA